MRLAMNLSIFTKLQKKIFKRKRKSYHKIHIVLSASIKIAVDSDVNRKLKITKHHVPCGKMLTLCLMRSWFPRRWSRSNNPRAAVVASLVQQFLDRVLSEQVKVLSDILLLVFKDHWAHLHSILRDNLLISIIRWSKLFWKYIYIYIYLMFMQII